MPAISIRDRRADGVLRFDLLDLLRLIGPAATASQWMCSGVEATGNLAAELHDAADHGTPLSGADLLRIASGVLQVVDGDFEATAEPGQPPWLRIRAIDSAELVVITTDLELLARIRASYDDVRDSPEDDDGRA